MRSRTSITLTSKVAEAAASEVEAEEGGVLRNLAAGVNGLEAAVGLRVVEARDLQFVEALAVHDDRALGSRHFPIDAEHLARRHPRSLDHAAGAALEAHQRLDLVLVLDRCARRVGARLGGVSRSALRHGPRREEGLLGGDHALGVAHQILRDRDHVRAEIAERARARLLAGEPPGERQVGIVVESLVEPAAKAHRRSDVAVVDQPLRQHRCRDRLGNGGGSNSMFANMLFMMFQDAAPEVGWDLITMWHNMGYPAKTVVFILFVMSAWSVGIMIDRALMYSAARKQSRVFVQQVAGALKDNKLDEAISIAERNKKSHIAKVVATGLSEFQAASAQVSDEEVIEAAKRGLERSVAIVHAEMKRGLSGLATIGSTAPFVGLFGTVMGIINAFKGISAQKVTGLSAVAGGIAEALVTTALGLLVAVPAVWTFNYFTNRVEAFDVEMDNSSMELINYFITRRSGKK